MIMKTTAAAPRVSPRRHRSRGFSLIELMVAVAILAIVAAIGYPSFQGLLASQRVRAAEAALYDSLLIARSEALKSHASTNFVTTDLASGWSVQVGGQVVHAQSALAGVSFSPSAPNVVYDATGRLGLGTDPLPITVTVTGSGSTAKLCIEIRDQTGSVKRKKDGACP
ncbi:GspH/FimT family pseudopilin [Aromatoleum toluclasticum]|uniref:GspH/FimT family pseudopilin n=1 Tax=Aromatoleum toluclasticum TaxID=92003 RepID=UPI00036C80C2|nr:GspH/FimT family pseudopilin [Aromatoleum toluclasticum]